MNEIADHTRIVSVAEMQRLEKEADAAGQSYAALMEQAGTVLAEAIQESFPRSADRSVLVLAGPGNNGGDGLVCARHLSDAGYRVRVYLWKRKTEPQEDYEGHFGQLIERNVSAHSAEEDVDAVQLRAWLDEAAVVVDALLGTGANRPIQGALARILQQLAEVRNRRSSVARAAAREVGSDPASEPAGSGAHSPPAVVAVDVPSGLNADSGALDPATVAADMTVTFGCAKTGHFQFPGAAILGELVVADIGIPPELTADLRTFFLTPEQIADHLPTRSRNSHKGTFGKGMAVVGSVNYPGAAFLSCAGDGPCWDGAGNGRHSPARVGACVIRSGRTYLAPPQPRPGRRERRRSGHHHAKAGRLRCPAHRLWVGPGKCHPQIHGAAFAQRSQAAPLCIAERVRYARIASQPQTSNRGQATTQRPTSEEPGNSRARARRNSTPLSARSAAGSNCRPRSHPCHRRSLTPTASTTWPSWTTGPRFCPLTAF